MDIEELLIPGTYRQEIRSLKAELEELEAKKTSIRGYRMDETGSSRSGRSGAYFEEMVMKYDKLYARLRQTTLDYINAKEQLSQQIERLDNETHKNILLERYVFGKTAQSTSDSMGYNDIRQFYKVQRAAKQAFEELEDD